MCLAYPMEIREIRDKKAVVEVSGISKEINVEFLPGVKKGDYVMVHAGFAIQKVDTAEAKKTLAVFKEYRDVIRKSLKE